jgi:hypothetical protein
VKASGQVLEKDDSETINLKQDLDLRRLLRESHLLEQAKTSAHPGSHRHKATELRLQSLGSRFSLLSQEKMPISHRKGIAAKTEAMEARRRKDAQENGTILEKAMKPSSQAKGRRDRGIDAPSLGRFRGGTLKLSRNDIAGIQGPKKPLSRARRRVR